MPYSKILEYGISMEGLPSGVVLKNPTAYGKATLQQIIDNKDALKLHGNIHRCYVCPYANTSKHIHNTYVTISEKICLRKPVLSTQYPPIHMVCTAYSVCAI